MLVSTREPKGLLNVVAEATPPSAGLDPVVQVFSSQEIPGSDIPGMEPNENLPRISQSFRASGLEDANEREIRVCGPPGFDRTVAILLGVLGLEAKRIHPWDWIIDYFVVYSSIVAFCMA